MRFFNRLSIVALSSVALSVGWGYAQEQSILLSEHPSLEAVRAVKLAQGEKESYPGLSQLIAEDELSEKQLDFKRKDGRWLGPNWWANRLHDWSVKEGAYVCNPNRPFLNWRVAHDMTREISGALKAQVTLKIATEGQTAPAEDSVVGFLVGAGHTMKNRLAKALIFDYGVKKDAVWPSVEGSGIALGVNGHGLLRMIDLDKGTVLAQSEVKNDQVNLQELQLMLTTTPQKDGKTLLKAVASYGEGSNENVSEVSAVIPQSRLVGGLSLLSHPGKKVKGAKQIGSVVSTFKEYQVESGTTRNKSLSIGPIAAVQYTVDRGKLKLTAQCLPQQPGTKATLSIYKDKSWKQIAEAPVHERDQAAYFQVESWDQNQAAPYRVKVPLGDGTMGQYTGLITAEPTGDQVRLAALGCIVHRPWGFCKNWTEFNYFPHHEIVQRTLELNPDVVFFYGDQMYEGTPTPVDTKDIAEDFTYKWLYHCLAFRECLRNRPSVTIPDDHDVYQGNFWAQGGRPAPENKAVNGGYARPGDFVAQVHRVHSTHLPDGPAPDALEQGILCYHCDWNWGGVSFAIIGDRLFKQGPNSCGLPSSKTSRADHYNNPDFNTEDLDFPGLHLLGTPQEEFLEEWSQDWSHGAKMKVMLSQSPLGNLATHHAGSYLIADLDSNGWPQSGRKRALQHLRAARAVHVAGDQHLSTLVQHGIDEHDDAVFGFTAPATSNAYARAYAPLNKGPYYKSPPPTPEQYLGQRLDGFKNKVTFHAVANPDTSKESPYTTERQVRLNQQVPGLGIVDFNTKERTITFQSLPRSYEVAERLDQGNYPGWPKTVAQDDNDGRKPTGELFRIKCEGEELPVINVYAADGSHQWSKRASKKDMTIYAYQAGEHTVKINGVEYKASPSDQGKELSIK